MLKLLLLWRLECSSCCQSLSPLTPPSASFSKKPPRPFLFLHSATIFAFGPGPYILKLFYITYTDRILQPSLTMWSAILRTPPVRCIRAPGRALASSFTRGRPSPQGPRNGVRRPERISSAGRENAQPEQPESSNLEASQPNITNYDPSLNTLLAPVHIPEDPNAVLKERHPATGILTNSGLVVQRQLEMMNVMV